MIFRNAGVPRETCGGKIFPIFRFARNFNAKEVKAAFASFKPTLTGIVKREGFFRRMFRGGPNLDRKKSKIIKTSNQKKKKILVGRVKIYFFVFWQTKSRIDHRKRYKTILLLGF